ncbi:hypothetical protein BC829DRAFT_387627 [Chytridium lagenaria]|nr:hypothetical protein BC829DRAFT_387627 [Chytridium lagenaria]
MVLPSPPPQVISPITGFPTWRTPVPGVNLESIEVGLIYSALGMLLGLFLAYRYDIFKRQAKGDITSAENLNDTGNVVPLTGVTALIRNYIIASIGSALIVMPFDLGKIFSTLGAVHNSAEVALCIILASQYGFKFLQPAMLIYLTQLWFLCLVLPWPYDALFFKWQGLIFDFYLFISFLRLYVYNKFVYFSSPDERRRLIVEEGAADENEGTSPLFQRVLYCVFAAFVHVGGNVFFVIFQTCYGIAYPLYGFFVYKLHPKDVISRYPTSLITEMLYLVLAVVASTLSIGIAVYQEMGASHGGEGNGTFVGSLNGTMV